MKYTLTTLLICISLFEAYPVMAETNSTSFPLANENTQANKSGKVDLRTNGGLRKNTRSSSEIIEVAQTLTGLFIQFNRNLGNMQVTLTNEDGTVAYQTTTNTASTSTLSIDMGSYPVGVYTISFSCQYGGADGGFEW